MLSVLIFAVLLALVVVELVVARKLTPPVEESGPAPLVRPPAEISPETWNPPGQRAWEALDQI